MNEHTQQLLQPQQHLLLDETGSDVDVALATQRDFPEVARRRFFLSDNANADPGNMPKDYSHASVPDAARIWRFFVATAAFMSGVGGLATAACVSGLVSIPAVHPWATGAVGEIEKRELLLHHPLGNNAMYQEFLGLAAMLPLASCSGKVEDMEYMAVTPEWHRHVDHVVSPDRCCALCSYLKQCRFWTWVRDAKLSTGSPSQCWLKGGTPGPKVQKAGVVSGFRAKLPQKKPPQIPARRDSESTWRFCPKVIPPLVPPQHCSQVDEHTDYVDEHPWKRHVDHVPNPGECCSLCSHFPQCRAWSWVEDAQLHRGCPAQCWLKGLVGSTPKMRVAKQGVISGVRASSAASPPAAKRATLVASTSTAPKPTLDLGTSGATSGATTAQTTSSSNPDRSSTSSYMETSTGTAGAKDSDILKDTEWPTYARSIIEGALQGKLVTKMKNATAVAIQADDLIAEDFSTAPDSTKHADSPKQQLAPTMTPTVLMVPDGMAAEDAVAVAARVAHASVRQAPQHPKELTFYMYRATGKLARQLENANAADLAGVMLYLHREVVTTTPRKFGIDRIRRYRVTVRNTQEFFNVHHTSLGAYLAFEGGRCTSPLCGSVFKQYGYIVGCQLVDDVAFAYRANAETESGKCQSSKCQLPVWYSLPGPCPFQSSLYRKRRLSSRKLSRCAQKKLGGQCKRATGKSDCTYSVEEAGYVLLDELAGISDYASWSQGGRHKEYVSKLDRGVGAHFWDGKQDIAKCAARVAAVQALFKRHYPKLPEHLHEPPCDFDMYYKGEFSWPINHTGNVDA